MKTIIVDTIKNDISVVEVEDELTAWYNMLHCDIIDITRRNIVGKAFDIVCDDVGLLKPNRVSMVDRNFSPMLVGSIAIANSKQGELESLTDEDITRILGSIVYLVNLRDEEAPVIKALVSDDVAY